MLCIYSLTLYEIYLLFFFRLSSIDWDKFVQMQIVQRINLINSHLQPASLPQHTLAFMCLSCGKVTRANYTDISMLSNRVNKANISIQLSSQQAKSLAQTQMLMLKNLFQNWHLCALSNATSVWLSCWFCKGA